MSKETACYIMRNPKIIHYTNSKENHGKKHAQTH